MEDSLGHASPRKFHASVLSKMGAEAVGKVTSFFDGTTGGAFSRQRLAGRPVGCKSGCFSLFGAVERSRGASIASERTKLLSRDFGRRLDYGRGVAQDSRGSINILILIRAAERSFSGVPQLRPPWRLLPESSFPQIDGFELAVIAFRKT